MPLPTNGPRNIGRAAEGRGVRPRVVAGGGGGGGGGCSLVTSFEGSSLNDWSGDLSPYQVEDESNISASGIDGSDVLSGNSASNSIEIIQSTSGLGAYPAPDGGELRAWVRDNLGHAVGIGFGTDSDKSESGSASYSGYMVWIDSALSDTYIERWDNGSFTQLDSLGTIVGSSEWTQIRVAEWTSAGDITIEFYEEDGTKNSETLTANDSNYQTPSIAIVHGGDSGSTTPSNVDFIQVC